MFKHFVHGKKKRKKIELKAKLLAKQTTNPTIKPKKFVPTDICDLFTPAYHKITPTKHSVSYHKSLTMEGNHYLPDSLPAQA